MGLTLIPPPSGKQELNQNVNLCLLISPISPSRVDLLHIVSISTLCLAQFLSVPLSAITL